MNIGAQAAAPAPAAARPAPSGGVRERGSRYAVNIGVMFHCLFYRLLGSAHALTLIVIKTVFIFTCIAHAITPRYVMLICAHSLF